MAFRCEVSKFATEPAVVTLVAVVGVGAFLTFAYISEAVAADRSERRRVLAERDAFEEFADQITSLAPASTDSKALRSDNPITTIRTVNYGPSDDVKLRQVLAEYRNTVMSVSHYREEYDETISESLSAELGPDIVATLDSNETLTTASQLALVRRSRQASETRSSLAEAIDEEIEALRSFENDLSRVDRQRQRFLKHLDGVSSQRVDAIIDIWKQLNDLEDKCDEIARERQEILSDPPMTLNPASEFASGHAFYKYLYQLTDGPQYPVLAQVSELAEQIRDNRDCVMRELASRQ